MGRGLFEDRVAARGAAAQDFVVCTLDLANLKNCGFRAQAARICAETAHSRQRSPRRGRVRCKLGVLQAGHGRGSLRHLQGS